MSIWEKFGMEDWRGVIAVGMLALTGFFGALGKPELAMAVFSGFMAHGAIYFYSKGE
jgi:hypothetical protein